MDQASRLYDGPAREHAVIKGSQTCVLKSHFCHNYWFTKLNGVSLNLYIS